MAGGVATKGGNTTAMGATAQVRATAAFGGTVATTAHASTPGAIASATHTGNFFNDSGNQVFAQNDSATNMMTQGDVEQEHTAKSGTLMQQTMKSNARKSVDAEEESGYDFEGSQHMNRLAAAVGPKDSFNTPQQLSPTFLAAKGPTPVDEEQGRM